MELREDIVEKAKEIERTIFKVEEVSTVPDINNSKLTFACTGLKFFATVLYIDMRRSTSLLNTHLDSNVAKIHMIYYNTIVRIAKSFRGEIRSFNGDSLLVFFTGDDKDSISNAVESAMTMSNAINNIINEQLPKYKDINFGIGIDHGSILATKVGIGGDDNNKDLIWIGNAVNKACKISDECKSPYNIGISGFVYYNLNNSTKYYNSSTNMWVSSKLKYNDKEEYFYKTLYYNNL